MVCRCREYTALAAAAAAAAVVTSLGCDPVEDPPVAEDGPEFLIVGPTEAPASSTVGTVMFAQGRGGNYLGVIAHGCSYSVGALSGVQSSCTFLPVADGLRFVVAPAPQPCVIEARLYLMCDATCEGGAPTVTATAPLYSIAYCDENATLVETVAVWVAPPPAPSDAGSSTDALAPKDVSAGDADR
jgi:hypothetical protein